MVVISRYGAGQWRGLETHRLMPELYFPVAGAEFLRRRRGRDPAELLKTSRISSNALHPDEWTDGAARTACSRREHPT
jgi:hypothetical protein